MNDRALVMYSVDRQINLIDLVGKCNDAILEGFFVVDGVRVKHSFSPEQLLLESFEQKRNALGTLQTRIYCRYNERGWNVLFDLETQTHRRVVRKDGQQAIYEVASLPV